MVIEADLGQKIDRKMDTLQQQTYESGPFMKITEDVIITNRCLFCRMALHSGLIARKRGSIWLLGKSYLVAVWDICI